MAGYAARATAATGTAMPLRAKALALEHDGQRFVLLPLSAAEAWVAGHLDPHHSDPFDRAMVAQALVHSLRVVTRDSTFAAYGVDVLVA